MISSPVIGIIKFSLQQGNANVCSFETACQRRVKKTYSKEEMIEFREKVKRFLKKE